MINVGGNKLDIQLVDKIDGNSLGQTSVAEGYIKIARSYNCSRGDVLQSTSSREQTFYHELTHAILTVMDKRQLNDDEEFVCTFSSFLCAAMQQIIEIEVPEPEKSQTITFHTMQLIIF